MLEFCQFVFFKKSICGKHDEKIGKIKILKVPSSISIHLSFIETARLAVNFSKIFTAKIVEIE